MTRLLAPSRFKRLPALVSALLAIITLAQSPAPSPTGAAHAQAQEESQVTAAPKPDFSGEYELNHAASTLSTNAAMVRRATLTIEHEEPKFRTQGAFHFDDETFEFTADRVADGRETFDQASGVASSLSWDGDTLVSRDRSTTSDFDMTWRYELLEDGQQLKAVERIRGGGRDQDNVWVFERR